jgi:hypothetical protein
MPSSSSTATEKMDASCKVKNGTAQLWAGRPPYGKRRAGNHNDCGKQREY